MGYIYIIKNSINDKVYIGQTRKTVHKRFVEHLRLSSTRSGPLYNAMNKYGKDSFFVEEIGYFDDSELDSMEEFYIKKYNSLVPNGYNIVLGNPTGNNDNPMYHQEVREKVSKHFIGDLNPSKRPEVREKIRKSRLGSKASEETKIKMSKNNGRFWKGKHLPKETRDKISKNHWCNGRFGGLNPNAKKVQRLSLNDEVLEEYDSISEAIIWVRKNIKEDANASNISQAVHGGQKTAFGFKWKLIDEV